MNAVICPYTPGFNKLAVDFETPGAGVKETSAAHIKRCVRLGVHGRDGEKVVKEDQKVGRLQSEEMWLLG